jgi:Outer membrane lipoprotein carrier protein LolA-like
MMSVPRRTAVLLLATAAFSAAHAQRPVAVPEWGLPQLMTALSQVKTSTARFVETKYLHVLNQAQKSSGRLIFIAPGHLQKETIEPAMARLTIDGDRLTIERQGEQPRVISLRDYSEIGPLVESVRATLAGDLPGLTRNFATTFAGGPNGWTLTLVPLEAKLRTLVAAIRIQGSQSAIRDIETMEADGDRIEMAVTPEPK